MSFIIAPGTIAALVYLIVDGEFGFNDGHAGKFFTQFESR